ncbi:unnamed protein product [Brassica rapa subsp. trilocularis]
MDYDVQPTIDYFNWLVLGSNPEIEKLVNAEEGTKAEIEGLSNAYPQLMMCSKPATSCSLLITSTLLRSLIYDKMTRLFSCYLIMQAMS